MLIFSSTLKRPQTQKHSGLRYTKSLSVTFSIAERKYISYITAKWTSIKERKIMNRKQEFLNSGLETTGPHCIAFAFTYRRLSGVGGPVSIGQIERQMWQIFGRWLCWKLLST